MLKDEVHRSTNRWMRFWAVGLLMACVLGTAVPAASAAGGGLVVSYAAPGANAVNGRAWTYDSAVAATAAAATGNRTAAQRILDVLARIQRPDGGFATSYGSDGSNPDSQLRTGVIAWVGLAAAEYRVAFCQTRYDGVITGVMRWLMDRRGPDGLVTGGPDVSWVSTEHNLEARAFFARIDDVTQNRGACTTPIAGLGGAQRTQASAALAALDAGIGSELFHGTFFGQGVGDDAHPVDAQAMGIQWLLGQGRRADALAVAANADATLMVSGRTVDGYPNAGAFTGYKPFAEGWGPDVLWMEGTLQMRMAKAALGQDTSALDASIDRWAALTQPGMLLHSNAEVVGNPAGDYHVWPAAAPAAWLTLARSGSDLLR
jgi:hypothetical protein